MVGERFFNWPLALKGGDVRRLCRGGLGGQIIFGGVGLQIFELKLHLRKKPAGAFGAGAVLLAPELGDLQLVVRDQRLGGALPGTGIGQFCFSARGPLFGFIGALRTEPYQRLERFDIVRQGRNGGVHNLDGIIENLPDEAENAASAEKICAYPALCGRQLYCGFRQSTPSSRQASCELVSDTTPSFAAGQMNFPRSNRFEYNDIPRPSCQIIFTSAPLRPRKTQRSPANGSREKLCCTIAAKLCMPRRISVWPIAIHTRAPAGIIAGP